MELFLWTVHITRETDTINLELMLIFSSYFQCQTERNRRDQIKFLRLLLALYVIEFLYSFDLRVVRGGGGRADESERSQQVDGVLWVFENATITLRGGNYSIKNYDNWTPMGLLGSHSSRIKHLAVTDCGWSSIIISEFVWCVSWWLRKEQLQYRRELKGSSSTTSTTQR